MYKQCSKCNQKKTIENFSKIKNRYHSHCRDCRREYDRLRLSNPEYRAIKNEKTKKYLKRPEIKAKINSRNREFYKTVEGKLFFKNRALKSKYNISLDQYEEMLEKQDHKCIICGISEAESIDEILVVDHCHKTNQIRGLLCGLCNKGIGFFKDNPKFCKNAANYLQHFTSR